MNQDPDITRLTTDSSTNSGAFKALKFTKCDKYTIVGKLWITELSLITLATKVTRFVIASVDNFLKDRTVR
jgi:hypothetical protein